MERVKALAVRASENITNIARVALLVAFTGLGFLAVHLQRSYEPGTAWVMADTDWGGFLADWLIGVGPELVGIGIGVVTLDYLNERRQEQQFKAELIRRMGSQDNGIAELAVKELAHRGWLSDGSLRNAFLWRANLNRVYLENADLQGVKLVRADLRGATLMNANLKSADLWHADARDALILNTNLADTNLGSVNFRGAIVLPQELAKAKYMDGAIMPDGTKLKNETSDDPTFEEWLLTRARNPPLGWPSEDEFQSTGYSVSVTTPRRVPWRMLSNLLLGVVTVLLLCKLRRGSANST